MNIIRYACVALIMLSCSACARFHVDEYIKGGADQYKRQLTGSVDDVFEAVKVVFERHGWKIEKVEDPATYERNEYTERVNQKRYLLITDVKEQTMLVDTAYVHFNIYLYQVDQWTDIDIRYQALRTMVKNFYNYRNDKLVNQLLDEIEKEIGE